MEQPIRQQGCGLTRGLFIFGMVDVVAVSVFTLVFRNISHHEHLHVDMLQQIKVWSMQGLGPVPVPVLPHPFSFHRTK